MLWGHSRNVSRWTYDSTYNLSKTNPPKISFDFEDMDRALGSHLFEEGKRPNLSRHTYGVFRMCSEPRLGKEQQHLGNAASPFRLSIIVTVNAGKVVWFQDFSLFLRKRGSEPACKRSTRAHVLRTMLWLHVMCDVIYSVMWLTVQVLLY